MMKRLLDKSQRETLEALTGGRVAFERPLASLTTFKAGGNAEAFYEADDLKQLSAVVSFASSQGIPYMVIGRGSNLLVRDGGIGGLVIRLAGALAAIEKRGEEKCRLHCGAGLSISDLLQYCRREGLAGLEFLAGIPGTIGGAAAMNAGAFGGEISSHITALCILNQKGHVREAAFDELSFSYRRLCLDEGSIITRCSLSVSDATQEEIAGRMSDFLKRRAETQPLDLPSAGSVFKNPPGAYAGRLIEEAGLKGASRGGAEISSVHANWIVNRGGARASDILWLIDLAARRVRERTGIELELEIKVVGEDG